MERICTNIEQSKKLLEIGIDINTADMYWLNRPIDLTQTKYALFVVDRSDKHIDFFNSYAVAVEKGEIIPAWSLAALLDILPNNKVTSTTVTRGGWNIEPIKYLDIWFAEYETEKHDNDFSLSADNPVDACYEIIIKLKEKNLL